MDSLPSWLSDCEVLDYSHTSQRAILGSLEYKAPDGKWFTPSERSVSLIWYPWAIHAASQYLRREERVPAPDSLSRLRVQRVLGHLVLELGDAVEASVGPICTDWAYIAGENLFAFDMIP